MLKPIFPASPLAGSGFGGLSAGSSRALHSGNLASGNLAEPHGDPSDRLLPAQALVEAFTLVSDNPEFAVFGIPLLRGKVLH